MSTFNPRDPRFVKTLVEGIEEGLVLTVGLLCGAAIAGISGDTIMLMGTIFVFTGGVSLASRAALSDHYTHDGVLAPRGITAESIMFLLTYVVAGLVPLVPYMVLEVSGAFTASIVCGFALAFIIGLWSGRRESTIWKSAWHLAYVAAGGAIIGAIAHALLH